MTKTTTTVVELAAAINELEQELQQNKLGADLGTYSMEKYREDERLLAAKKVQLETVKGEN